MFKALRALLIQHSLVEHPLFVKRACSFGHVDETKCTVVYCL